MSQRFPEYTERRSAQRFIMRVPLTVDTSGGKVSAQTRDLSTRGLFFWTTDKVSLSMNQTVEFVIVFPPEATLSSTLNVRCKARIVRILNNDDNTGVAVEIEHYRFMEAAEA